MLVIERRIGDKVFIGNDVIIQVVAVHGHNRVRIGFDVPAGIPIWRDAAPEPAEGDDADVASRLEEIFHSGDRSTAGRDDHLDRDRLDVLLVEDDPVHTRLIERAIRRAPWVDLRVLSSGNEVLDELVMHRSAKRPDLILLDLGLPDISGMDILRALKQNAGLRDVPVVVLSAMDTDEAIQSCLDLGANAYVSKSDHYDVLCRSLYRIANFWRHAEHV